MPSLEVFSLTDYYLKNMYYVVFDFFSILFLVII